MRSLPSTLFRVVYQAGYGYPRCTRREETQRTFGNAQGAADQLASIARWPEHHKLVGVYRGDVRWSELDPAQLPPARERSKA